MEVVVDTAAGYGYLLWPNSSHLPYSTQPCDLLVKVADGRVSRVTRQICALLDVGGQEYSVCLRVLLTSNVVPSILCGRSLIERFGLVIHGCSKLVTSNGVCLFNAADEPSPHLKSNPCCEVEPVCVIQSSPDPVRDGWTSLAVEDSVFLVKDGLEGPIVEVLPAESLDDPTTTPLNCSDIVSPVDVDESADLTFPLSDDDKRVADQVIHLIGGESRDLLYCSGAKLSLRVLPENFLRDLADQTHQFVLSLAQPECEYSSRSYSHIVYSKLPPSSKVEFDRLVSEFLEAGWWQPVEGRRTNATSVFLHKPGATKARLVADFRAFNSRFRDVSSEIPLIDHLLWLLRTECTTYLELADCAKAFYRIALEPPVTLQAGGAQYECRRVSFGLSMGPEALRGSLGLLIDKWKEVVQEAGFLPIYLDDFALLSNSRLLPSLIWLLRRCGFAVSRKKFQDKSPYSLFNQPLAISFSETVQQVTATCESLSPLLPWIEELRKAPTKRKAFQLAGKVGHDPLKVHAQRRLCADLIRSIAGRATKGWDAVIAFENDYRLLWNHLLTWSVELCATSCSHETRTFTTLAQEYVIYCDASLFGYAFVIKYNGEVVYEFASAWKKCEFSYHSNRLEGLGLLRVMRQLTRFLEFRLSCAFGQIPERPRVSIYSDSKSALAWAQGRKPSDANSVEYRMILRLQEALTEEVNLLKTLSTDLSLRHVEGESNEADGLSRLLYRQVTSQKSIGQILRASKDVQDQVSQITPVHLLEGLASECHNWDLFLERFSTLCASFDALSGMGPARPWEWRLASSLQTLFTPKQASKYVQIDGVYCHEWTNIQGIKQSRPVIPLQAEGIRRLIVRHYHKLNNHRGRVNDISFIFDICPYYIERLTNSVAKCIRQCLICSRLKARAQVVTPPYVLPRQFDLPPFSRVCCDTIFVSRREPVLTVMCVDTGIVFLDRMPDGTIDSVLGSLRRLSSRYVVQLRRILWDNAKAFGSDKTLRELRTNGHPDLEIVHTPVHGSTSNPIERIHRECWSVLRSRPFVKHLRRDNWKDCIEDVSATINRRPIGIYEVEGKFEVLTPAKLAFGACYGVDGARVIHIRRFFYEQIFLIRRRRHTPQARRASMAVGSLVLIKNFDSSKLDLPFYIARVVSINQGSLTVSSKGVSRKVPTTAVAPLDQFFSPDSEPEPRVVSSGGHVVNSETRNEGLSTRQLNENAELTQDITEEALNDGP